VKEPSLAGKRTFRPLYEPAGIGVVLGVEEQNIVVKRILPDTPVAAPKAIHLGDKIMAATEP